MNISVKIRVNGILHEAEVEPRLLLTYFLRETCGLTGTHVGCETSVCGACTVLVDGQAVKSCTMFAVQADGAEVTTVEGLTSNGEMHPVQEGFWECHGLQCGYCTPGQICSAIGMLDEVRRGIPSAVTTGPSDASSELSEDELKERMSGNLCRCGAYVGICDAIRTVHERTRMAVKP